MKLAGILFRAVARRTLDTRSSHGIALISGVPGFDIESFGRRTQAALDLLRSGDPRQFRRVHSLVGHIFVWPGVYNAYDRLGGVLLSADFARAAQHDDLIGALVHEATHLRIVSLGVKDHAARRSRIESLCVREQLNALVNCELITAAVAERVWCTMQPQVLAASSRPMDIERSVEAVGLPRWMARLFSGLLSR